MARLEPGGITGRETLAALQVLQSRIQHFFYAAQFRAPQVAHIVEALIDGIEPPINGVEPRLKFPFSAQKFRVDIRDQHASQRGVEQQLYPHRKVKLFVGHHERSRAPLELFCHNAWVSQPGMMNQELDLLPGRSYFWWVWM